MTDAPDSARPTALVTGASSGIGAEYARQLAARGYGLVLVARDVQRLEALAVHLGSRHGVPVEVLPADLSDRAQAERVAERLCQAENPVDLLVNNAGYGLGTTFLEADLAAEEDGLAVMVRAVMVLCQAAARSMRERGHGAIVNISSVASLLPYSTYGAHKAWVARFSEGLEVELQGTGVTVQAVLPGLTRTEFHERSGQEIDALPGALWLTPQQVVAESLAGLERGEGRCVSGRLYRVATALLPRLPRRLVIAGFAAAEARGASGRRQLEP